MMVDVAYIDEVTEDAVYVIADGGDDYEDPDTFTWIREVIRDVMRDQKIPNVRISLER